VRQLFEIIDERAERGGIIMASQQSEISKFDENVLRKRT